MLSEREVSAAVGGTAYGADDDKLGTVEAFFVDDRTGAPTWVALSTGLLGTRHSVVPAGDATFDDGILRIPVTRDAVKNAPTVAGDHLAPADEEALRRHYGLVASAPAAGRHRPPDRIDVDRPSDGAMTRSEERLRLDTERVAATRVRLVKYVVTEEVQITVPIRREEIRVEQVPVDAAPDSAPDAAHDDVAPGETLAAEDSGALPGEIILHTERPVVTVEVVPVERVRLRTEIVHGQETVTEQVQREQIAVDQHAVPRRTG
jgi:stress response protein YsnF